MQIGTVKIESKLALAPMAGVTDAAFRQICSEKGAGYTVTELLVEEYVSPLLKQNIDTLILGCTHYPLLTGIFSKLCGLDVALIDPGYEAVVSLRELLSENDALRGGGPACGEHYYVSDSEQQFLQYAEMFLRGPVHGQVQRIDIENY